MFELSSIPVDAPLPFIAVAVLFNLVRHALNLHHERKKEAAEEVTNERIVVLSSKLAKAEQTIEHLREEVERLKNKGA